jgi:integrase
MTTDPTQTDAKASKSGEAKSKDSFVHGGKTYRLITRKGSPFYNLRFVQRGKIVAHSLKTDIRHIAIQKAITFLKALEESQATGDTTRIDRLRTKSDYCTIDEIAMAWKKSIPTLRIAKRTAMDYIGQLEGLLRVSTGREEVGSLRSNILTKETVDAFVEHARKQERPDHSIASQIVHARAVFKKSRMDIYKDLKLPDLTMFRGCSYEFESNDKTGFVPFTQQEMLDLANGAEELYRDRSPVWVVYALMNYFGLRNDMVYRLKWEDFTTTWPNFVMKEGVTRFTVRGNYKEAKAVTHTVPADLWVRIESFRSEGAEYIVPSRHKTERHEICYREINAFFDRFIDRSTEGERKKSYLFRRQYGTILADKVDIYAAQRGLGHRSVTTTEKFYGPRDFEAPVGLTDEDLRSFGEKQG